MGTSGKCNPENVTFFNYYTSGFSPIIEWNDAGLQDKLDKSWSEVSEKTPLLMRSSFSVPDEMCYSSVSFSRKSNNSSSIRIHKQVSRILFFIHYDSILVLYYFNIDWPRAT